MERAMLIADDYYTNIREVTLAFLTDTEFTLSPMGGKVTKSDLELANVQSVIIKYLKGKRMIAFVL